ncbi:MAG TPA: hypothetical protein ENG38_01485 [Thermoplasmatales archaeon]|nr:hypothetical protein [Thermoplasmatales archaeon]HEX08465.1 hypothetical protein [Thermoplasmatales archaeon]
MREENRYLTGKSIVNRQGIRTELCFLPLLILLPFAVSIILLWSWYYRGFSMGCSDYDGELMLALIILIGNIVFDIPFVKSLVRSIHRK